ncbi:MAG: terminase large subunit [Candidatus Rokubacteria bacterium]|nr:terminase large subunit [Candidatus Rokubacteria bacterium]
MRWAPTLARRVIAFFPALLRLVEGVHADQPFVLLPFQQFIVGSLFGWRGRDGFRRFRHAYVEIAKGGGKSPMLAGLLLYALVEDGEAGAEIYAAAVTREQAKIVFADAAKMALASPGLAKRLVIGENNIAYETTRSFIRPVSSEARSLDGRRVHIAGVDELHEHPTALVTDKMRAGTKGRRQPLVVEITNAGYDRRSVCWQHHEYSRRVLEGLTEDEAWFAYVCQLDACAACRADGALQPREECATCDSWRDEHVWLKANPGLGPIVTLRYLREQVREAVGMPAKESLIRRLNFCHWTDAINRWLDMEAWHACTDAVTDAELLGQVCFAGLDLGQSDDFSALALLWLLEDGRAAVRMRYWLPEVALATPGRPYDAWRAAGRLTVTDGTITDYDLVERDVIEACRTGGVRELAYDKRFAAQMALHLEGAGLTVVDMPQGYALNEALRKINDLVKTRRLVHGGDPILAWMAANAVVRQGARGEVRLDKDKAQDKIDGVAALAMALARAMVHPHTRSIYETRGIRTA